MHHLLEKIRHWYRALPDKKRYAEFITAVLSVPVMVTVIILNWRSLSLQKAPSSPAPVPTSPPITIIAQLPAISQTQDSATSSPKLSPTPFSTPTSASCRSQLGPITLLSPQESEVITQDAICIELSTPAEYCSPLWSYSLDGSTWSNPISGNLCLYNQTNGNKQLQIKVTNPNSSTPLLLQRSFVYQGQTLTSTPTPTASPSASPQPTPVP